MNISFNNGANAGLGVGREMSGAAVQGEDRAIRDASNLSILNSQLTIAHATATPEEIAAAGIPESALTRDDALGNLIGSAFSLPPPPMPDFERLCG